MKINLDTVVRLRLTPQGKLMLAYWVQDRSGKLDQYQDLLDSDAQDLLLWEFISIFGKVALFAGIQQEYFPDGIEILESE